MTWILNGKYRQLITLKVLFDLFEAKLITNMNTSVVYYDRILHMKQLKYDREQNKYMGIMGSRNQIWVLQTVLLFARWQNRILILGSLFWSFQELMSHEFLVVKILSRICKFHTFWHIFPLYSWILNIKMFKMRGCENSIDFSANVIFLKS